MKSRNSILAAVWALFVTINGIAVKFQDIGLLTLALVATFPASILITTFQPSEKPRRFGRGALFLFLVAMAAMATWDVYLITGSWAAC